MTTFSAGIAVLFWMAVMAFTVVKLAHEIDALAARVTVLESR